ncbi:MAG: DNA repair protein RecO [Bacilli bacterium]|nr:DNA repair protein RecO [Bacilli bacterium]
MAKTIDVKYRGVVIRVTAQKESDAMVNCYGEEGFFSFYARGVLKMTSKNGSACQPLVESDFLLGEGIQGGKSLKEASLVTSYVYDKSLDALSCLSLIQELTLKVVQPEESKEMYPWFISSLKAIKDGKHPYTVAAIYFAKVLNSGGFGMNVDCCAVCGSKERIIALNYEEGGYICQDCFDPSTTQKADPRKLKILRYIFRCGLNDLTRVEFEDDEMKEILFDLFSYLDSLTGVALKTARMIR